MRGAPTQGDVMWGDLQNVSTARLILAVVLLMAIGALL